MRITHVVGTNGFSGLERLVAEVACEQAGRGHDVRVLGGRADAMTRFIGAAPVAWRPAATARECVVMLAVGGRRDIVHSHITPADVASALAAGVTRGLRVSTRHITHRRGYRRVGRAIAPWVRRQLDLEIAVSAWTSSQLEVPSDAVLLNGVLTQETSDAPREKVVLIAQRLDPEKDTIVGIRAWAASRLAHQGWELHIAGSGTEEQACRQEAERLGVSGSTRFLGWVADIAPHFRSASVLLAPAPTEPCGISILQAMAVGMPVVAAATGGNAETIGSVPQAHLFDAKDHAGAAARLRDLEAEGARTAYGERLAAAQRERFSIEVHVDALLDLYERARRGEWRPRQGGRQFSVGAA